MQWVIASKFLHDESFQEHVVVFLCVSCVSIVKRHTLGSSTSTFSILKLQSVTVNRVDREESSRLRYWERKGAMGVIYFPTNWGAKELQNPQNHRVVMDDWKNMTFKLLEGHLLTSILIIDVFIECLGAKKT